MGVSCITLGSWKNVLDFSVLLWLFYYLVQINIDISSLEVDAEHFAVFIKVSGNFVQLILPGVSNCWIYLEYAVIDFLVLFSNIFINLLSMCRAIKRFDFEGCDI